MKSKKNNQAVTKTAGYTFPDVTKDAAALKRMSYAQAEELCANIRSLLLETASRNGGHVASNLGVVELTVAMHRVFNSPVDQFVFDVGHQCYTHKILTGRADQFSTIRREGGLAGFPKPSESEHDPAIAGHSSTSISIACGLARAKSLTGQPGSVVAVIGDGALSGGLAYEGLNNAGRSRDNIIVILNDNKMSISKNVGAMARYLAVIRGKKNYVNFKTRMVKALGAIPLIGRPVKRFFFRSKSAIKNAVYKNTLFDALGFAYLGPVDGHNMQHLEQTLEAAKMLKRPAIVHVCTIKGKGYPPAEREPDKFHGIGKFDIDTGEPTHSSETYSNVFGRVLCDIAAQDDKVFAITAAMKTGTGLSRFAADYHNRFYDCGIAEEHAVTFSAGLAAGGVKPVVALYSSFIQRAYDQIIHDVAIQHLNVTFAVDRAGVVGEDGETHHGVFDCAMLNSVPGLEIYSPCYFAELEQNLRRCIAEEGPAVVRYPRGVEPYMPADFAVSDAPMVLYGEEEGEILLVTYGMISSEAFKALDMLREKGVKASLLKLCRIKPIGDEAARISCRFASVYFFEEGIRQGGIGESFLDTITGGGFNGSFRLRAIDNRFVAHAPISHLLHGLGLDAEGMTQFVLSGGEEVNG
ncbi:MAG: 1-deoxy-D-xylulose-5-phosphate synthase [Ruminococcaceae bacterium]|nr:1-deoxy-D-xylulose-5-phosphate synthase [Oscillospiraceae bacterium]